MPYSATCLDFHLSMSDSAIMGSWRLRAEHTAYPMTNSLRQPWERNSRCLARSMRCSDQMLCLCRDRLKPVSSVVEVSGVRVPEISSVGLYLLIACRPRPPQ
jgi:hypothetical protein